MSLRRKLQMVRWIYCLTYNLFYSDTSRWIMEAVGTKCGDVMRTHKCERCLSLFRTWDELRVHKRSHPAAKRRHECDTCGMEFSKKEYLRRHLMKKHDVVLEKGRCGRKSKYKCSDDDPRPYKCTECIREFAKYKPFNRHRQTHQKRFCDVCQEYVQTYAEHMKKVHGHEVPRNFHCDICNRAYRTKSDIVMHMKMHILMIENRTIPCKLCERTFYFNHDLRRHMKTHSLLRTIICDICGESFKTSETLKTHMRRHTGEKPFVCAFCPRWGNSYDIKMRWTPISNKCSCFQIIFNVGLVEHTYEDSYGRAAASMWHLS